MQLVGRVESFATPIICANPQLMGIASLHPSYGLRVGQSRPVVAGESLEAAIFAIEELEETAKLYLLLRGLNPRYLTPAQVKDLSKAFGLELPEHGHD
jgi:hypothetical protein